MAETRLEIDQLMLTAALRRLDPARVFTLAQAALSETMAYLEGEVVKSKPLTPGNTGVTRGTVFSAVHGTNLTNLWGEVGNPLAHTVVLELGRRPGARMPPPVAIELWALRKLGKPGLGFIIARNIARRGLPAHHMFANAARSGLAVVRSIWMRHLSRWAS